MVEGLRELIARWRAMVAAALAEGPIDGDSGHNARWHGVEYCADELEAALAEAGRQEETGDDVRVHIQPEQVLAYRPVVTPVRAKPRPFNEYAKCSCWIGRAKGWEADRHTCEVHSDSALVAASRLASPPATTGKSWTFTEHIDGSKAVMVLTEEQAENVKRLLAVSPPEMEPELTEEEVAAMRVDFEAFVRKRNITPEVFAIVCPWAAHGSRAVSPSDAKPAPPSLLDDPLQQHRP